MKIRIGGVPEHFNFPWYYGIEKGYFANVGIDIEWHDYPGGTGAMSAALRNDELDMALLLTEGAVREISAGAPFKITKTYVDTPLIWGIHTSSQNNQANLNNLTDMRYAISRFGSGSHLMAFVHAQTKNIQLREDQMVVVGDISNARTSLASRASDLFFWEKFMTKPFVDSNELKLLDVFPTPWPCFVLVTNNHFYEKNKNIILTLCHILNRTVEELKSNEHTTQLIADKFKLKIADIEEWLSNTKWNSNFDLSNSALQNVQKSLLSLSLINNEIDLQKHLSHDSVTIVK